MQRYIPQRRISQRLILSCVCPIAVSDSTLFFIYTCSYLHLLARKYTSRHIHHITTHHIYITLQKDCNLGSFLGFLFPLFSLLLATHWMFHLSFCEVFPLFFGIWFLVLRGICDILEHGRWILHFETSTCRLARYLQHFTPKINQNNTNNCGLLVSLAIFCCCGLWLSYVIVRVSCGSCCSCCFCCFCCSCWFVFVAVVVVVVPVAVAVGESEM